MDFDKLEKVEQLPLAEKAFLSLFKELGESLNKHATVTQLIRHLPTHERFLARKVVWTLLRAGILHKHRTDTFSWTPEGLEHIKKRLYKNE